MTNSVGSCFLLCTTVAYCRLSINLPWVYNKQESLQQDCGDAKTAAAGYMARQRFCLHVQLNLVLILITSLQTKYRKIIVSAVTVSIHVVILQVGFSLAVTLCTC